MTDQGLNQPQPLAETKTNGTKPGGGGVTEECTAEKTCECVCVEEGGNKSVAPWRSESFGPSGFF